MRLPQNYRDPGFQRRIAELERAEQLGGRNKVWEALLAAPWVTDHEFYGPERQTHCPHGHVDAHPIGWPHENHAGREHVKRQCSTCGSVWMEPVEAA